LRLSRRYEVARTELLVGGQVWELFGLADPDRLLERCEPPDGAADSPGQQPYWTRIWDSARVLAEELVDRDLRNLDVLDLGCGLGLVGAVAASRGARVLMCDVASHALLFARLNGWPWRGRIQTRRLNWRSDRLAPARFDWILGADILYEMEDWPYLETFWREHLRSGGTVLLSEPNRVGSELFPQWIARRGWKLESSPVTCPGVLRPLRLLQLQLPPTDKPAW
jgi:predicted nicotinamide N-methyase